MDFFVSYSRDDKNIVYELFRQLNEKTGHTIWIDQKLMGGDNWWDTILQSVEDYDCFIFVITPASLDSVFCKTELHYALALEKPILPILLKEHPLPEALAPIQFINVENLSFSDMYDVVMRTMYEKALKSAESAQKWEMPHPRPQRPPVPISKPIPANNNEPLVAKFTLNTVSGKAPLEINFENRSQGRISQYMWDFNGDGMTDNMDESPGYTYRNPGQYRVRLTISNVQGETDMFEIPVHVFEDDTQNRTNAKPIVHEKLQAEHHETKTEISRHEAVKTKKQVDEIPDHVHPDIHAGRMVRIPGGEFIFGNNQRLSLPEFYIDVYPVTNQDYFQFMQETKAAPPSTWRRWQLSDELAIHPVTGLTYKQILHFCDWIGKSIPSPEQWEKAARGTNGHIFPWGDHFDSARCNFRHQGFGQTTAVNQYLTGESSYHVYDMLGNVWEITSQKTKSRKIGGKSRIIKGGSFKSAGIINLMDSAQTDESTIGDDVGFRCVWIPD